MRIHTPIISILLVFCFPVMGQDHGFRYFMQGDNKGSETPYGNNTDIGNYMDVADTRIWYEVYGEGKPLLVLHGGSVGSDYEIGRLIDSLRQDFMVILPTNRGQGRSYIGTDSLTYEMKAKDMMTVATSITREPISILGFSDGAYTAYKIANLYPSLVERIVAIGAGTLTAGFFPDGMSLDGLKKADPSYMEQVERVAPEPERLEDFYNRYMQFWHKSDIGKETFGDIHCPVLLISGEHDRNAPLPTVNKAATMIPNVRQVVVKNAGHTCFLDDFDATWAPIGPFLHQTEEALYPAFNGTEKKVLFDLAHSQCTDTYEGYETYPWVISAYKRILHEVGDARLVVNEDEELTPSLLQKADVVVMLSPLNNKLQKDLTGLERKALVDYVQQGGSLIFFIDDAHRVDWERYGAADVAGAFGIRFGADVPLPGNVGAVAFPGNVFSQRWEIPYSGACLMSGGTPVSVCMEDGHLHGTIVTLEGGGRIYIGGDTMVGLLLGYADGGRKSMNMMATRWWGKDSYQYMKELLTWALNKTYHPHTR